MKLLFEASLIRSSCRFEDSFHLRDEILLEKSLYLGSTRVHDTVDTEIKISLIEHEAFSECRYEALVV